MPSKERLRRLLPCFHFASNSSLILLCLRKTSLENFEFRQSNSRKYTRKNYAVLKRISGSSRHFALTAKRYWKLFLLKSISELNIESINEKNVRIYCYCSERSANFYIWTSRFNDTLIKISDCRYRHLFSFLFRSDSSAIRFNSKP